MKVLICGSREWNDIYAILRELRDLPPDITVIHGAARGADRLAGAAAEGIGLKVVAVPAEWNRDGRGAGPVRNQKMLDMGPDLVVAFPVRGSRGTMDMIRRSLRKGVKVRVYDEATHECKQVESDEEARVYNA